MSDENDGDKIINNVTQIAAKYQEAMALMLNAKVVVIRVVLTIVCNFILGSPNNY